MATHSSILAFRIPWTEEPSGLQSTGWQRVGHDWATSLHSLSLIKKKGFPGGSDSKASACNVGDLSLIPGSGQSPRKWQHTSILLFGKFHGWRSLVDYISWDRKESDTTEQFHWYTDKKRLKNKWYSSLAFTNHFSHLQIIIALIVSSAKMTAYETC